MENTSFYLSEYGNIWAVEHSTQYVYCNDSCVTSHFEVASYPSCKVGECLYAEDHYMNSDTTSREIIAINEKMSDKQATALIEKLDELRKLYGPLSLSNKGGQINISVFVGDANFSYITIGTVDFDNATITLNNDLSIEGLKLEAQENWKYVSEIIEIFEDSMEFDCEITLDGNNPDLSDARADNAYQRLMRKKIEKEQLDKDKDEPNIDEK